MNTKTIFAGCIALLLSTPGLAKDGPLVSMDVVTDRGGALHEYSSRGQTFVAGTPNERYSIRLQNNTGVRVLVVLSVDGINAVTGQTAGVSQRGYVLAPYGQTEVAGWRKDYNNVARFYFTNLGDSYGARTGRPQNVGVLGIAAFEERQPYPRYDGNFGNQRPIPASVPSAERSMSSASADMAKPSMQSAPLGTGHGEMQTSYAGRTEFIKASTRPTQVTQIRYDSYPNLVKAGIIPRRNRYYSQPEAFPNGFVPDP